MKMEHTFAPEHGFSGSAGKSSRPKIPGYKHGGEAHAESAKAHFGKSTVDHDGDHSMGKVHYDEHGFQMHKHGGKC